MVKGSRQLSVKRQSITRLFLLIAIIIVANILSNFLFTRIDMTSEKRFSLSTASKDLARGLKDVVFFRIYLEGDLPPGFNKLKNSMREMLDEFRVYANGNIDYEFIDPAANADEQQRNDLYKQLSKKGLYPTNLEEKQQSGQTEKIIFPGAIVNYRSREFPLQILKTRMGSSPEQMLNASIENLEYEIANMLRRITLEDSKHIGFLQGQNEYSSAKVSEAVQTLSEFYKVDSVVINGQLNALKDFDAVVIAGPDTAFDDRDKFILDQYIMHGGKIFWLIDKMQITMDSLTIAGTNIAMPVDLNIDDMLFKYGVRINPDLVMDMQAAPIPIVTGYIGNQPHQQIFPWYYFPLLETNNTNPIVHNLNSVKAEFPSSIDTIEAPGVNKTILLSTGKFSRLQMAPARVSLNILREEPDQKLFSRHSIPVAVLLEGTFSSNYVNRIPSQIANSPEIGFKDKSSPTSMIVVSDADIISNYISKKGNIYPLGYDRITRQTYGNKNFILNSVDYLCGYKDILTLRGKEFRLRLLDPAKIKSASTIEWLNIILSSLIVIIFGLAFNYFRKKKYEHR
jgi:ABC-2 type transport system permease protein